MKKVLGGVVTAVVVIISLGYLIAQVYRPILDDEDDGYHFGV